MKRLVYFILFLLQFNLLTGQGEIDDQESIFYRNERTYAFLLNSNGFGGNFRYGKRIDAYQKTIYEIEIDYLKHPREERQVSFYNKNFIYGKKNAVVLLKGSIGYQKEIFQKRDLGGISIRYFVNAGPTFAFLKPIYYEVPDVVGTKYEPFDKQQHSIIGKAPLRYGFDELKVSPGIYGKFGYSFEYSKVDNIFRGIEVGAAFDAYFTEVEIMADQNDKILLVLPDKHFIFTLFISMRIGRVIDTRFNPKRSSIDNFIID